MTRLRGSILAVLALVIAVPGQVRAQQDSYPRDRPAYVPPATARLWDARNRYEQVFVFVDSVRRDTVFGRIASPTEWVRGYHRGQRLDVPVSDVLDWTISKPDGTEEGNLLGKFMDEIRLGHRRIPCATSGSSQGGVPG